MLSPAITGLEFISCTFAHGAGQCILKGMAHAARIAVNALFPTCSYEDLDALDGGDDGMRVIKTILTLAPTLLKDSG